MKRDDITVQPVGTWLENLASAAPAPGGGAAAAMNVAMGAALIEMVCNLTVGKPRYAEYEDTMVDALARAGELRTRSLQMAEEDAEAFGAVSEAYKLPKGTADETVARTAAIQAALQGAADVPLRTAEAAGAVIGLAGEILEGANVNVISDVAVAAASARAGLESAAVNVEINLAALADATRREELAGRLARLRARTDEVEQVMATVSRRIGA